MNKRYFYTDSIAAAWMAKHFKMKFESKNGEPLYASDVNLAAYFYIGDGAECYENRCEPYYVRSDSLPLLKSIDDDLIETGDHKFLLCAPERYARKYPETMITKGVADYLIEECGANIIQRGKAFHWPESE